MSNNSCTSPEPARLRARNRMAPRYGTKYTDASHEISNAAEVTAKIAKVYSPVTDLARPIGRKPAAVISVPVSIGIEVIS